MWTTSKSQLTMSVYKLPAEGILEKSDTVELIQLRMVTLSPTRL